MRWTIHQFKRSERLDSWQAFIQQFALLLLRVRDEMADEIEYKPLASCILPSEMEVVEGATSKRME